MQKWPERITRNLSLKLSLAVVAEIALLLMVSLGVILYFSRRALKNETMHHAGQRLEGTVQHIDNILLSVEQSAGNIYCDLIQHLDEPEVMESYCRIAVQSNPYIVGCAIVFKPHYFPGRNLFMAYVHCKGNCIMTTKNTDLVSSESFGNRPYTEQVWYTMPMETKHPCWTDPLKGEDTEGAPLCSFCLPLHDKQGDCVGVFAVDLPIALLSNIVLAAKPSPNGYSVLLGHNGSFIVHPDENKLNHQTIFTQTEHGADASIRQIGEAMVKGERGFKPFRMNGKKWYVLYEPFVRSTVPGRALEDLRWSVGVVYPEDDIFGEYNQLLTYVLGIAIIGLLLFYALCRLFTYRQLLPLNMLTQSARRIADGNYGETIPDTHRGDEVGLLQDRFQEMQQALDNHIGELKELTATLQERGEVLEKAYAQAKEADRMKTAFLHNMSNQMIKPAETIGQSVMAVCDHYHDITLEQADHEMEVIEQQSQAIIDLITHLVHTAENTSNEKEDSL
jgi:methyl-accepting chemotaxis protein/sigma-B regulation protein RsbU (phosphoserine phosphatase)